MSEEQVGRLLKDAVRQQAINSMPVGKRRKAMEEMEDGPGCEVCGEDDCECDDDNATKVAISRRGVKPNLPSVTSEDMPKGMNLSKYQKKKGKK
ncbi:MAG: hypothetical protein ACK52I_26300 [Pseudomonadota bacterium]